MRPTIYAFGCIPPGCRFVVCIRFVLPFLFPYGKWCVRYGTNKCVPAQNALVPNGIPTELGTNKCVPYRTWGVPYRTQGRSYFNQLIIKSYLTHAEGMWSYVETDTPTKSASRRDATNNLRIWLHPFGMQVCGVYSFRSTVLISLREMVCKVWNE